MTPNFRSCTASRRHMRYPHRMRKHRAILLSVAATTIVGGMLSCSSIERARPRPKASSVTQIDVGATQNVMRGTVGAESVLLGYSKVSTPGHQPIVVRGYGLVVDLNGTGSSDIPPAIRAHMIEYMERRGVGQMSFNAGGITPQQLLDSPNTAVVIVEGIVPPASVGRLSAPSVSGRKPKAIPGTIFDLRVQADPQTGTTSLEGGRLFTTDLRPGPLMTGSRQASIIAEGKGPLFINPFFDPRGSSAISINKLSARILNGGEVLEDIPLKLMLTNPSHTRVRLVQDAINRRFPQEAGQRNPTASGKSDSVIELTVPPSMRDQSEIFIELVKHSTLRQANAESVVLSTRRMLLADTNNAPQVYWRWCAIGERCLPLIRELYDYPEELPRLVALRSGAFLRDPIAAEHLRELGVQGDLGMRLEAAELLKNMPADPRTDRTLRTMLNDDDVEVRLRAYEGLAERQDPLLERKVVDKKFVLDRVSSEHPMIYISQSSMPRIAVFGKDLEIDRPVTMGAWDNRLLVRDSEGTDHELEIYYRANKAQNARIIEADANAFDFLQTISRRPTIEDPRPGLDLSYSETVGAIHALWAQGHLNGDFKAEQDRLLAAIRRYGTLEAFEERPEFDSGGDEASGTSNLEESLNRRPATIRPLIDKRDGSAPAPSGSTPPPSSGSNSR